MHISKWGNSLAIRLPASIVQELGLKEGDALDMNVIGHRTLRLERRMTREEALDALQSIRWPMPADYKFDRNEIYEHARSSEADINKGE